MKLSDLQVVIPTYRDDQRLAQLLKQLTDLRVIVVDGDSSADTRQLAQSCGAQYTTTAVGRGGQISHGIQLADADWLWILHADSNIDVACLEALEGVLAAGNLAWGRFSVRLPGIPLVAGMMNLRSRLTRICTGDQGMFFHRELLEAIGGFPVQPLMEDIELSKRLKRLPSGVFVPLTACIVSSARRWQSRGIVRTVVAMWWFRLRYFFGAKPERLYELYYR